MWTHVTAGAIDTIDGRPLELIGPPDVWADAGRWWDLRPLGPVALAGLGWHQIIDTPRPADTATTTTDRAVALVAGTPTVTWTARPWTTDELDGRARRVESERIIAAMGAAITHLETLAAYPALPAVPAGALTIVQVGTIVRALRDEAQTTRAGAQSVALTLRDVVRYLRGDFAT